MEHQRKKQVEALKVIKLAEHKQKPKSIEEFFSKDLENNKVKNEFSEIKKIKNKLTKMTWNIKQVNTYIIFKSSNDKIF